MKAYSTLGALLLLMNTACSSIDSENIPTDSMTAHISVQAHENGVTDVRAILRMEDSALTYLDLTGGEYLTASMDGRTTTLHPSFYAYHGSLSQARHGSVIRVGLNRNRYRDAQESVAIMPAPFNLRVTAEPNGYDDTILLQWNDRTRERTRVKADGHCMSDEEWEFSSWNDTGELRLSMSQLPIRSYWSGDTCSIELTVQRCRDGVLDPSFYGGQIEACQVRKEFIEIYR